MTDRFQNTAEAIKNQQAIEKLRAIKDGTLVPIPLEVIETKYNIRSDESGPEADLELAALAASIKEVGLLQNPVITIYNQSVHCVTGHRRIKAMSMIGESRIPCIVRHFNQLGSKEAAQLIENTARRALHPMDIANQLAILKGLGYTQLKLQELLGKDRKTIGRFQKMSQWPDEVKDIILKHSDRIKTGMLLQLASRDLSDEVLLNTIKHLAGLVNTAKDHTSKDRAKWEKILTTFAKHQFTEAEQTKFITVLRELGFIRSEHPQKEWDLTSH